MNVIEKEKIMVPTEYLRVYDTIQNSKEKYVTKSKILNLLGYEYNSSNERWLRNTISKLIDDYGYPIGCSYKKHERGYYIITTEQEKQQAMQNIKKLADGSMKRYEALKRIEI
ncbi:mobile element-associated protein [Staphylococcus simiae CCM 7213 = CCUG 51256]|uniref:Mobile element-associated protein n=2 Tax=Staphylococcus simiae TaxID=308354 RepID=G5JFZ0_9STAP|nr:mobile element-associated protein [Staphylococcus simiae CCM 7213 = CCUG 51256]SNV60676.1 pathogenicity island protein [Staphylococcus simiae]